MALEKAPPEALLSEIEDLLRIAPTSDVIHLTTPEVLAWRGRASAVIHQWDGIQGISFDNEMYRIASGTAYAINLGYGQAMVMLHRARADIRMRLLGPKNIAIGQGQVFDYFDELRKVIEPARNQVFFVDPYLDAQFVSRYLPHVHKGVIIRLLTTSKASQLLVPALDAFCAQTPLKAEVRTTSSIHDRYLFIDGEQCYQSGASFKDGARLAPTTLTQITDAFSAMFKTYESLWDAASKVR